MKNEERYRGGEGVWEVNAGMPGTTLNPQKHARLPFYFPGTAGALLAVRGVDLVTPDGRTPLVEGLDFEVGTAGA